MRTVTVQVGDSRYDIQVRRGIFWDAPKILAARFPGRRFAVISDSRVFELYGADLMRNFKEAGAEAVSIVFPEGERSKTLETLAMIYGRLASEGFTRSDVVVGFGGGVTGDMAGLAAATFLRGMQFAQIPTTLLAMVDSSIGGKVAVDLPQGKNLVGAFLQPGIVLTDPNLLDSLSDRRFAEGMAELVKHGFIRDAALAERLAGYDGRRGIAADLEALIADSCDIKRRLVEADEKDHGERQLLNFGHTFGHALEVVTGYEVLAHGEAISIGMCLFTRMTTDSGLTEPGTLDRVVRGLAAYGLPTALPYFDREAVLRALSIDKKARSGNITIVYLKRIGEAELLTLPIQELKEILNGYL